MEKRKETQIIMKTAGVPPRWNIPQSCMQLAESDIRSGSAFPCFSVVVRTRLRVFVRVRVCVCVCACVCVCCVVLRCLALCCVVLCCVALCCLVFCSTCLVCQHAWCVQACAPLRMHLCVRLSAVFPVRTDERAATRYVRTCSACVCLPAFKISLCRRI